MIEQRHVYYPGLKQTIYLKERKESEDNEISSGYHQEVSLVVILWVHKKCSTSH